MSVDVGYYWAFAGERKCEYCGEPATRASHDGCYFCAACAMSGDMVLPQRPTISNLPETSDV